MGKKYLEYYQREIEKEKNVQEYGILAHEKIKKLLLDFGYDVRLSDYGYDNNDQEKVFIAERIKDIGMDINFVGDGFFHNEFVLEGTKPFFYLKSKTDSVHLTMDGVKVDIDYNSFPDHHNSIENFKDDIGITICNDYAVDGFRFTFSVNKNPTFDNVGSLNVINFNGTPKMVYTINQFSDGTADRVIYKPDGQIKSHDEIILNSSYEKYITELYELLNSYDNIRQNAAYQKILKIIFQYIVQQFISVNNLINDEMYQNALIEKLEEKKSTEIGDFVSKK